MANSISRAFLKTTGLQKITHQQIDKKLLRSLDDESKDDFVDAWDSLTSSITIPNSKKLVMRGTMLEESDAYFGFVGDE